MSLTGLPSMGLPGKTAWPQTHRLQSSDATPAPSGWNRPRIPNKFPESSLPTNNGTNRYHHVRHCGSPGNLHIVLYLSSTCPQRHHEKLPSEFPFNSTPLPPIIITTKPSKMHIPLPVLLLAALPLAALPLALAQETTTIVTTTATSTTTPRPPRPTPTEQDPCLQRKFLSALICSDMNPTWTNITLAADGWLCCWEQSISAPGNLKIS